MPVRDEHLILLGRHEIAGLDDGLAAGDADDDGLEGLGGGGVAGGGGDAVEDDVGAHAEKEEAEDGLDGLAGEIAGAEADAQDGERLLAGLHGALAHLAVGPGDLEDDGVARAHVAQRGIGDAAGVEIAERGEAVLENLRARLGVADREDGGDVLGRGVIGAVGVEGVGDARELGPAAEQRGGVARSGAFERGQLGEQHARGGLEPAERLLVEPVDRRHRIQKLVAGGAGLLGALEAERHQRRHAAGGDLVDGNRRIEGRDADPTDEHDGGDGDDEDEGGDHPAPIEELTHGRRHEAAGRAAAAAATEAADEKLELVANGHF